MNIQNKTLAIVISLVFISTAFAHGGHHQIKPSPILAKPLEKTALEQINERYVKEVKPIFQRSCFDCHSSQTRFPWYESIPGVKQWIQHDIHEAREHLDMDSDFPFKSHAEPLEDLEEIDKEVSNDSMPPLGYRIMHSGSALSKEDKEIVHQWIQFGKEVLERK